MSQGSPVAQCSRFQERSRRPRSDGFVRITTPMRRHFTFSLWFSSQPRTHHEKPILHGGNPILDILLGVYACAFVRAIRNYGVAMAIRNAARRRTCQHRVTVNPSCLGRISFVNLRSIIAPVLRIPLSPQIDRPVSDPLTTIRIRLRKRQETQRNFRYMCGPAHRVEAHGLTEIRTQVFELENRVRKVEECCERLGIENRLVLLKVQNKERRCFQLRRERDSARAEVAKMCTELMKERGQRRHEWDRRERQYQEMLQRLKRQIKKSDAEREAACTEIKSMTNVINSMRHDFHRVVASRDEALQELAKWRNRARRIQG